MPDRRASILAGLLWSAVSAAGGVPGTLVVAQSLDDIVSLDPAEGFELSSESAFTSLYQRLVQSDPDKPGALRATLASDWQTGPDGRSLVFTLRSGAAFAGGHPVRPEDVVYSLQRAVRLNRSPAFILNELGWTADNVGRFIAKVDERHVRVGWPARVGPAFVLNVLSSTVASIVDAVEVEGHQTNGDAGNGWLHGHSEGSGPFRIRRYIPHEALVMDANPKAPLGAPLLKTVILKNVADAASRRLLVEVGDADIARDLGPDQVAALRGKPELQVFECPSATVHYLLFNAGNAANPVLKNPALWEAARFLVDYDGIAGKLLKGQYLVHQAFLADGFPGALDTTPYHLDVAKARSILAKGGIAPGTTIKLDVFNQPPFNEIAQSLQSTFAQGGIRLQLLPGVASEVYGKTRTRSEEAVWLFWIPDYYDAHSTASAFAMNREDGTQSIAWRAGWHIPGLSALTVAAVEEQDPAARIRDYQAIQAQVQRDSPFVIALQERAELIMRRDVKGYRQGLTAEMVYYDRVTR
jgi:peptide/nickel transport system substrate-binding protein